MSPSGGSWRCNIAPVTFFSEDGAELIDFGNDGVTTVAYTSAAGDEYFSWTDAAYETPSGLARLFIERFPQIIAAGRGSDWPYTGWYVEMLGLTYPNHLPYAFADSDRSTELATRDKYWRTISIGDGSNVIVPMPPPKSTAN